MEQTVNKHEPIMNKVDRQDQTINKQEQTKPKTIDKQGAKTIY